MNNDAVAVVEDPTQPDPEQAPDQTVPAVLPTDPEQILEDVLEHRGWSVRDGQIEMVRFLRDAAGDDADKVVLPGFSPKGKDATVQAPVGTGKTLAYLVAGLARGGRIVVSTSTKALQDQVVNSELPRLADDLKALYGYDLTYSVLKGKSNYACPIHAVAVIGGDLSEDDQEELFDDVPLTTVADEDTKTIEAALELTRSRQASGKGTLDWEDVFDRIQDKRVAAAMRANRCRCSIRYVSWREDADMLDMNPDVQGDTGEMAALPGHIAANSEDFYRAAYARCMDSQVVVMNSTLLVHEVNKGTNWFPYVPKIMNGIDTVIVDEAHHLPDIISSVGSIETQLGDVEDSMIASLNRLKRMYKGKDQVIGDMADIRSFVGDMDTAINEAYAKMRKAPGSKSDEAETEYRMAAAEAMKTFCRDVHSRSVKFLERTANDLRLNPDPEVRVNKNGQPVKVARVINRMWDDFIEDISSISASILRRTDDERWSTYMKTTPGAEEYWCNIETVPVDVSYFRGQVRDAAVIPNKYLGPIKPGVDPLMVLCSGTISDKVPTMVGLDPDSYDEVESPFDPMRARLFLPRLPEPSSRDWFDEAWTIAAEAIETVGGRTLFLTTSRKRLIDFTEALRADEEIRRRGWTILSQADQGNGGKNELVRRFTEDEHSILVGTISFWEGVDVPGTACSLVILDKMPFPMQDDAVVQARRQFVDEAGRNPFMEVDVNHAATMIAQGSGRLVRSEQDCGGVMLMDYRAWTARYSSRILGMLPSKWQVTTDDEAFMEWLEWVNPDTRKGDMPDPDPDVWERVRVPKPRTRRRYVEDWR